MAKHLAFVWEGFGSNIRRDTGNATDAYFTWCVPVSSTSSRNVSN